MNIKDFIKTSRPHHYLKNLFVFAPVIFSMNFFDAQALIKSGITFLVFCLCASAIYFINDTFDKEADRMHSEKKFRPIASGNITVPQAVSSALALSAISIFTAYFFVNPATAVIIFLYFIINVFYSWKLKHLVIIDLFIIAFGFVLRIAAGGLAIKVDISEWILLCVIFLSLFLGLAKRREEYMNTDFESDKNTRKVLIQYDRLFLDQMISVIASLTVISYSLYTILNDQYDHLFYTIPVVIYGIFRYLFIIYKKQGGAKPEREMLRDRHILASVLIWAFQAVIILTFYQ